MPMHAADWLAVEAPDVSNRELAEFWKGTAGRQLLAESCDSCGTVRWPPRGICGSCHSLDTRWVPIGSKGRLFSWTVVWHTNLEVFKDHTPYAVGIIALEQVPIRMVGHVEMEPSEVAVDMPLEVAFREVQSGLLLPVWVEPGRTF